MQQVDTPQNLYDFPCNIFVAGFIGSPQMNFLDATLTKEGETYYCDFGEQKMAVPAEKAAAYPAIANYVGKAVKLGVRPEDIKDDEASLAAHPDAVFDAVVDVSELMGSEVYLYLECRGSKMTARVAPNTPSRTGSKIKIAFDISKMHLFDTETEATILN